jgi:hypothetical protein
VRCGRYVGIKVDGVLVGYRFHAVRHVTYPDSQVRVLVGNCPERVPRAHPKQAKRDLGRYTWL